MCALLDTDVILDLFLDRAPFAEAAAQLWKANEQGRFDAYVSAITPINVFYIARKIKGAAGARQAVHEIVNTLRIGVIDQSILQAAFTSPLSDYEDAVQLACALSNQVDVVVTRNGADYKGANIPVLSPTEFLKQLQSA